MTVRLAALLTSHNRAAKTLACLDALEGQRLVHAELDVILCDAASDDGTAERVRARFPGAVVLQAGSDVFWNGGMYRAFKHAVNTDYDFYLWLNDDTILDPEALSRMLATHDFPQVRLREPAIIVGTVRDPVTGAITYGGVKRTDHFRRLRFTRVPPNEEPVEVETMNGNCVLVSRAVVREVGLLDPSFTHGIGDFDYGLRARASGVSIWVAPGTVGVCSANEQAPPAASAREYVAQINSPKGLPPREWARFARRWAGPLWPFYAASPFARRTAAWVRSAIGR